MIEFELFLETANQVLVLLTGLLGLLGTGVGIFFAVKNKLIVLKEKTAQEQWAIIMELADKAMKEAEATAAKGEDKKTIVINAVSAACVASGIDTQAFAKQLDLYIDQTIAFVNQMSNKN